MRYTLFSALLCMCVISMHAQVFYKDANGKWGYIEKTGKEIIPLKYSYAYSFKNGVAKVELNDKTIYISKSGNVLK